MFKKPKRNFRGRRRDSGSDGENQLASENTSSTTDDKKSSDAQMFEVKKLKKKKKEKDKSSKSTVLSFDHGEEGTDTNVKITRILLMHTDLDEYPIKCTVELAYITV